jgi:hypothetical protein
VTAVKVSRVGVIPSDANPNPNRSMTVTSPKELGPSTVDTSGEAPELETQGSVNSPGLGERDEPRETRVRNLSVRSNSPDLFSERGTPTRGENQRERTLEDDLDDLEGFLELAEQCCEDTLTIKYPFRPHKCAACNEIFEVPKKLVEHMAQRYKCDFVNFACSICNRKISTLKGIAIHYGFMSQRSNWEENRKN